MKIIQLRLGMSVAGKRNIELLGNIYLAASSILIFVLLKHHKVARSRIPNISAHSLECRGVQLMRACKFSINHFNIHQRPRAIKTLFIFFAWHAAAAAVASMQ